MTGLLELVRRVVRQELANQRGPVLAVVSETFPHRSADDDRNGEASVDLVHDELTLTDVPIAVPHVGAVAAPRPGDLVLVHFLDGDVNQPVIAGRFYHSNEHPPLHEEDEVLFEHRVSDGTINHLRFAKDGSIVLQRDVAKPKDNTDAKAGIRIDGPSGDIELTFGTKAVATFTKDKVTITTNVEVVDGTLKVVRGTKSTTIDGNSIEGA